MFVISPVYARLLARELTRRGIAQPALFHNTALTTEALKSGADLLAEDFNQLLANAHELTGDPTLGLMIGKNAHVATLGPLGFAMANAPTLREGLRVLETFTRIHSTYSQIVLRSTLFGLTLTLNFLDTGREAERYHAEAGFLLLQNYIEMLSGVPLTAATFHFAHSAPDYADAYAGAYHSPVKFETGFHAVDLPRAELDSPSPFHHAELWLEAQQMLNQRLREMTHSEESTYTRHLQALMRSSEPPLPDLATVAAGMHISERTLSRRLRRENTSFRNIRSRELHRWARRYLVQTNFTVEAIAASLGYQDAANFRRAFRTRENCSPARYRAQLQAS